MPRLDLLQRAVNGDIQEGHQVAALEALSVAAVQVAEEISAFSRKRFQWHVIADEADAGPLMSASWE